MPVDIQSLWEKKKELDVEVNKAVQAIKESKEPLDVRWHDYQTMVRMGLITKNETYGMGHVNILKTFDGRGTNSCNEITLHDDFYIEKHETVKYVDLYEQIVDAFEFGDDEGYTEESIDAWREEVLKNAEYASFTFDW